MKALHLFAAALALTLICFGPQACKTWSPTGVVAKAVNCGEAAVMQKGLSYVGRVNDILASASISDASAQGKLADLGLEAGEDIIGCVLFSEQPKYAESSGKNPSDATSAQAAKRAQGRLEFLQSKGWSFKSSP